MPSIWSTSNPRPERSRAIHSFSRAADSATKRREAADCDRPEPFGAGTSPSGKRTERLNQRVALALLRGPRGGRDNSVHGVAFLSWTQHPEPTSSSRATPVPLFQLSQGHAATERFRR